MCTHAQTHRPRLWRRRAQVQWREALERARRHADVKVHQAGRGGLRLHRSAPGLTMQWMALVGLGLGLGYRRRHLCARDGRRNTALQHEGGPRTHCTCSAARRRAYTRVSMQREPASLAPSTLVSARRGVARALKGVRMNLAADANAWCACWVVVWTLLHTHVCKRGCVGARARTRTWPCLCACACVHEGEGGRAGARREWGNGRGRAASH